MNDTEQDQRDGLTASVMDYTPANLVPKGRTQGDYYSHDARPLRQLGDRVRLQAAQRRHRRRSRRAEEDRRPQRRAGAGLRHRRRHPRHRPRSATRNRFDLGNDPIAYAKMRPQLINELMPGLVERDDEGRRRLQQARRAFGVLLAQLRPGACTSPRAMSAACTTSAPQGRQGRQAAVVRGRAKAARSAGTARRASLQRQAVPVPARAVQLARLVALEPLGHRERRCRNDYPVHEVVLHVAGPHPRASCLSSLTLERLHDSELQAAGRSRRAHHGRADRAADQGDLRRGRNRRKANTPTASRPSAACAATCSGPTCKGCRSWRWATPAAPQDCQTVAYAELANLQQRMNSLLDNRPVAAKLDAYSRAHLQESAARIQKVLDARLRLPRRSSLWNKVGRPFRAVISGETLTARKGRPSSSTACRGQLPAPGTIFAAAH